MQNKKKTGLQFFAESAAAETETGAGVVIPADAGQNVSRPTLEELGVPKEKAASYRAFKGIPEPVFEQTIPETETPQSVPVETEPVQPKSKAVAVDFTWQDVMARDDMKAEMSRMVSQRVNQINKTFQPLMETLASHYGIAAGEDGKLDYRAITEKAVNDPAFYDKAAKATGIQDSESAQRVAMMETKAKRREQEADDLIRNIKTERHIENLRRQAVDMKQKYPAFDLGKELENPAFQYYISPMAMERGHGMTMEQAYFAVHGNEVLQNAVKDTAGNVADAYASAASENRSFPEEHSGARKTSGLPAKKYSEMTDEEFEAAKRNLIRNSQYGRY